jgi:hypothetical protein
LLGVHIFTGIWADVLCCWVFTFLQGYGLMVSVCWVFTFLQGFRLMVSVAGCSHFYRDMG